MLQPKKTKYRKLQRLRGKKGRIATRNMNLAFGAYGLKAVTAGELSSRQVEAARRAITHEVKRGGKIWIRVFPHKPISKKGAEVPMGSGKGTPEFYVAEVAAGTMVFEMDGVSEDVARTALRLAGTKLPVKSRFVTAHR